LMDLGHGVRIRCADRQWQAAGGILNAREYGLVMT
jgi:hypothetical protein